MEDNNSIYFVFINNSTGMVIRSMIDRQGPSYNTGRTNERIPSIRTIDFFKNDQKKNESKI